MQDDLSSASIHNTKCLRPTKSSCFRRPYVPRRPSISKTGGSSYCKDQAQITDASLLIALCADLKAWEREPGRYWKNAAKHVQEMILPSIDQYYRDKPRVQRDEAMRSCGILAQTLMLAAKSLGYDSCPMDGFDFDAVAQLINLPDDHVITMLLAIGKATEAPWPRGGQIPLSEVMVFNRFE